MRKCECSKFKKVSDFLILLNWLGRISQKICKLLKVLAMENLRRNCQLYVVYFDKVDIVVTGQTMQLPLFE